MSIRGALDHARLAQASLKSLAADIRREHEVALEHARSAVQRARHAGELLLQAKEQTRHGEWLPWLQANCPAIPERTAQAYMRLARHCLANPATASQLQTLTLREALEELAEPRNPTSTSDAGLYTRGHTLAASEALTKSATVTDMNAENHDAKPAFDPRNFARRMAEIDERIDRAASGLWANFRVDTDGLPKRERDAAWMAMLERKPTSIPLLNGHVTLGSIANESAFVLIESRKRPGYWHDIDLRHGTASQRPIKPLGLMWRFASVEAAAVEWTTAKDDGGFLEFVERP